MSWSIIFLSCRQSSSSSTNFLLIIPRFLIPRVNSILSLRKYCHPSRNKSIVSTTYGLTYYLSVFCSAIAQIWWHILSLIDYVAWQRTIRISKDWLRDISLRICYFESHGWIAKKWDWSFWIKPHSKRG